jgi:hypothetical protein
MRQKQDAEQLRSYLSIQIGVINMLLMTRSLEMLKYSAQRSVCNHLELKDAVEVTQKAVGESTALKKESGHNCEKHDMVTRESNSILTRLIALTSGQVVEPLGVISERVNNVL